LAVWWKREAICTACRVRKSASLLTASIVFGVADGTQYFATESVPHGLLWGDVEDELDASISRAFWQCSSADVPPFFTGILEGSVRLAGEGWFWS